MRVLLALAALIIPIYSVAATFTATQACSYANRIKQLDSEPTTNKLQVGQTYAAHQYNAISKQFVRISVEGEGKRWTTSNCGILDGTIAINNHSHPNKPANSANSTHSNQHISGQFDYYKLAVSFSQEFCLAKKDLSMDQCKQPWIVHGLWPQYMQGYPSNCQVEQQMIDPFNRERVAEIIPPAIIDWEWKKHGTCSNLSRSQYFLLTEKLWHGITMPNLKPRSYTKDDIKQKLIALNPKFTFGGIELACDENQNRNRFPDNRSDTLDEVRFCFDKKTLQPKQCTELENSCPEAIKVRRIN